MSKKEVEQIVRTGDCYRITSRGTTENVYVTRLGSYGLEQEASDLPYRFISYDSISRIERY